MYTDDKWAEDIRRRDEFSEYKNFIERVEAAGLQDAWVTYGRKAGGTHAFWDNGPDPVCILESDCMYRDYDAQNRGYKRGRIDYILLEKPRSDHGFNLGLTRFEDARSRE